MLSNTLNTNEVKNSTATKVDFQSLSLDKRSRVFGQISEPPYLPHRLSISHAETGAGTKARRRSVVRIDKTVLSTVDNVTPVTVSAYIVMDIPVGAITTSTEAANALAEILSFCATTGAGTTVLFDGTGNGGQALLTGGL